jgi:hypothetical protein
MALVLRALAYLGLAACALAASDVDAAAAAGAADLLSPAAAAAPAATSNTEFPMTVEGASSEGRALSGSAARSLVNTQTSWGSDPGCSGGTYAFSSGTGYCYAYSCAPAFGTVRIISTAPCTCMNSNDCFYAWQSNPGNTATSQFACAGSNLVTNTFGTCVYGSAVPRITYSGPSVSQEPMPGCSAQNPCSSGTSCSAAKCPARGVCSSNYCACTSDSDCVGSFLASQYTPQCWSSGQCTARLTYPTLTTCASCAVTPDGYWCAATSTCLSGISQAQSCAAGAISSAAGCTATACPGGQYLSSSTGSCVSCAAGTAYAGGNAASCPVCPANYYSGNGASSCTACPAGQISAAGSTSPAACTNPAVTSCPGGQYLSSLSGTCQACAAGTAYAGGAASSCTQCGANSYSGSGASSCTACPAGETSAPGSTSSAACASTSTTLVVQSSAGCAGSGTVDELGGNGCIRSAVLNAYVQAIGCSSPSPGMTFGVYSDSACTVKTAQYLLPITAR